MKNMGLCLYIIYQGRISSQYFDQNLACFVSRLPNLKEPQSESTLVLHPNWMVKIQSFIKSRGVLADKRYIVAFQTTTTKQ